MMCLKERSGGGAIFIICGLLALCVTSTSAATNLFDPSYSSSASSSEDPTTELKLVHVVFRHGSRTPADTYPNDPYINETFFPYGWGQMTNAGKKNIFESGEWLQQRYGNFLGKYYKPDSVWAQSTGVTRTQMSMGVALAGLYPPNGTPMEWNKNLNWQPIPVFSQPLDEDSLLLVRIPCPRYAEALDEVFQTPALQKVMSSNRPLFEELTNITGMSIASPDDVQSLYSTLFAEQQYGLELPEWTRNYYPQRLVPITESSYIYDVYTDELKSLKAGPFLAQMIGQWQNKTQNDLKPSERKIYVYCGHDSTIVNILAAIGVWQKQMPIYGIMAIFELRQDTVTQEYGVQMYLRRSAKTGAVPLIVPGCGGSHFCRLDKFVALTKNVVPANFSAACIAKNKNFVPPPQSGP